MLPCTDRPAPPRCASAAHHAGAFLARVPLTTTKRGHMSGRVSSALRYCVLSGMAPLALATGVQARPVIIESLSSFGTPDAAYPDFAGDVAIDGVNAIVLATR